MLLSKDIWRLQETHFQSTKDTHRLKVKGQKKILYENGNKQINKQRARVTILIQEKINFKTKAILQETKKDQAIPLLGIYPKKLKTLS